MVQASENAMREEWSKHMKILWDKNGPSIWKCFKRRMDQASENAIREE